jgi:hypothetical protein
MEDWYARIQEDLPTREPARIYRRVQVKQRTSPVSILSEFLQNFSDYFIG